MLSRRDFVKGGVALVTIGTTAQSLLKGAVAFAAQHPEAVAATRPKTLILVQLAGGNDGLRTLIPYEDGNYFDARPTLAIDPEEVLPLEDGLGLHPNLRGLHELWSEGTLAVVQGVGYPNQNYSHFKSMAIWQAGDPELSFDNGWLGRTLEAMESEIHDPLAGFNIGTSTPPELRNATVPITSVQDPEQFGIRVRGRPAEPSEPRTAALLKLYEEYPANSPFGVLLETTADTAVSTSQQLQAAAALYEPAVDYPQTAFAAGLSVLAQAIVADLGVRVGHISLGGFDTHTNEAAAHDALMATLDEGLSAFYRDLEAHGRADDVIVATWSEFARRVRENANGGTDHGAANCLFVLGRSVRRGLYGDPVSLTDLIDGGNLRHTVDFRSVYATLIERWFGVPHEELLGGRWPMVDFLPSL